MATLVLQTAGQAIGGALGGPLGATLGRAAGAIAGSVIDQTLFSPQRHVEGARLSDLRVLQSSEGAVIPRVWGRFRLAGNVIWATNLEEVITTRQDGGKAGPASPRTTTTTYTYFANLAIGLAEGPIDRIGRVWADGKEIDISSYQTRFYRGDEQQLPDSLIIAKEGAGNAPAYRGLSYLVFERLPLERFGNRLPQFSFEIYRALDDIEPAVKAVNIIPGATEFGYDTEVVTRHLNRVETRSENAHTSAEIANWTVSVDQLQETAKQVQSASLVCAWFGSDLRCGQCVIRPGVDNAEKVTSPVTWQVAGLARHQAHLVSQIDERAAFGGTPNDASVIRAIRDLTSRGLKVLFNPFLLMDIPPGNMLADPYGNPNQPVYPWRGAITCEPAPGQPGSPDQSAAVLEQVDAFFGNANALLFWRGEDSVSYFGFPDWRYRHMVLHYAHLCAVAGGVDAFIIGSELRGLTTLRADNNTFPVVEKLKQLAADVAAILPDTKISYGADWSEYFGYQPTDGSGDVFFHLDPLWSSSDIDFIGIDNYMPLSDWRDGSAHLDFEAGHSSIYDLAYLRGNVSAGEGFDWFYASQADRRLQQRTPITDGAYNKPWVFRYKDIASWWSNLHYDRIGGVELAQPTTWQPAQKPVWFVEAGCAAIDKGTNQPNVFFDPKSVQSGLPYFSNGVRDDFLQRRYVAAMLEAWGSMHPHNPISPVYGGPMLETDNIYFWAWDARPFPTFPTRLDIWADGENYARGHWLNGRLGAVSLEVLIGDILHRYGFNEFDTADLIGVVDGYVINDIRSARAAIEPLAQAFAFDAVESGSDLRFVHRDGAITAQLICDNLVAPQSDAQQIELVRSQETDLPLQLNLEYFEPLTDYRRASVSVRRLTGTSGRTANIGVPAAIPQQVAVQRAEIALQEIWAERESAAFSLPLSLAHLQPGDVVELVDDDNRKRLRLETVSDGISRAVSAVLNEPGLYTAPVTPARQGGISIPAIFGPPAIAIMDLPTIRSQQNAIGPWAAGLSLPWPGALAVFSDSGDGVFDLRDNLNVPAALGETVSEFNAGPVGYIDRYTSLEVDLFNGTLESVTLEGLLRGRNLAAVGSLESGWELFQFQTAELQPNGNYLLGGFLRGQFGSAPAMSDMRAMGAIFVLFDLSVKQLNVEDDELFRELTLRVGPSQLPHSHAAYVEETVELSGTALKPLAPVHLRTRVITDGLEITWIRQTRIGGDNWEAEEVPLAEDNERYELEIVSAGQPIRSEQLNEPRFIYSNTAMQSDFGVVPAMFDIRVYQISARIGRGTALEETINV